MDLVLILHGPSTVRAAVVCFKAFQTWLRRFGSAAAASPVNHFACRVSDPPLMAGCGLRVPLRPRQFLTFARCIKSRCGSVDCVRKRLRPFGSATAASPVSLSNCVGRARRWPLGILILGGLVSGTRKQARSYASLCGVSPPSPPSFEIFSEGFDNDVEARRQGSGDSGVPRRFPQQTQSDLHKLRVGLACPASERGGRCAATQNLCSIIAMSALACLGVACPGF